MSVVKYDIPRRRKDVCPQMLEIVVVLSEVLIGSVRLSFMNLLLLSRNLDRKFLDLLLADEGVEEYR